MEKKTLYYQILVLISFFGIWEVIVAVGLVSPEFFPSLISIGRSIPSLFPSVLPLFAQTIGRVLIAFSLAAFFGVWIGSFLGTSFFRYEVFSPYLWILYVIPRVIFLPFIILALGVGGESIIGYGMFHAILPIILLTTGGVKDIDPELITIAHSMGASKLQKYIKVIIPAAFPTIKESLRLGAIFSLLGVLLSEMFIGVGGVGSHLIMLASTFQTSELFSLTFIAATISLAVIYSISKLGELVKPR